MSYAQGRRPSQFASKSGHSHVIGNELLDRLLRESTDLGSPSLQYLAGSEVLRQAPSGSGERYTRAIAIDGSRVTATLEEGSLTTLVIISIAALTLDLEGIRALEQQRFVDPDEFRDTIKVERWVLGLPVRNISRLEMDQEGTFRYTLHEFLGTQGRGESLTLYDTLYWLITHGWSAHPKTFPIVECPRQECEGSGRVDGQGYDGRCDQCRGPIYLADYLQLHELLRNGSDVTSNVLTLVEQIVLIHLFRREYDAERDELLRGTIFIKDGPLAVFQPRRRVTAPLAALMQYIGREDERLFSCVGAQKSGRLQEYAQLVAVKMEPGQLVVLDPDHIQRYVIPDPYSEGGEDYYGRESFWGGAIVWKQEHAVHLLSIPHVALRRTLTMEGFLNIADILAVLETIKSCRYDNALMPIALADQMASISHRPGARILGNVVREGLRVANLRGNHSIML